jgi:hypothetical protein
MDVHDPHQDQEKSLFQRIYEGLVGGVSQLLENFPRQEMATKADIPGPLENSPASTWQVLVHLIQNAVFKPSCLDLSGRGPRLDVSDAILTLGLSSE